MTLSAPSDLTKLAFFELVVVVTSRPRCLAYWTANVPIPPAPAWIRMRWPARALTRENPCRVVSPTSGSAAASVYEMAAGFRATNSCGSAIFSANVPMVSREART